MHTHSDLVRNTDLSCWTRTGISQDLQVICTPSKVWEVLFKSIFEGSGTKDCENMLWGVVRGGTSMNNTNPGSWPWHFPGKSCLRNWLYAPVVNSNYQASYLWYLDMLWVKWKLFSRVLFFVTSWTIQFIEFSWPEYWSGYPFPSPVDLPNPETEPRSPTLQADSLPTQLDSWLSREARVNNY